MCHKWCAPQLLPAMESTKTLNTTASRTTRGTESRKVRKPLMEKKRRARINDCLNELKRMLLAADADLQQPCSNRTTRPAKLEKADILELTVRHVRRLQRESCQVRQEPRSAAESDPGAERYREGFSECVREVRSQLERLPQHTLSERLSEHLSSCLSELPPRGASGESCSSDEVSSSSSSSSSCSPPSPLVPTQLPNGDLALVIPATEVSLQWRDRLTAAALLAVHSSPSQASAGPLWRPW